MKKLILGLLIAVVASPAYAYKHKYTDIENQRIEIVCKMASTLATDALEEKLGDNLSLTAKEIEDVKDHFDQIASTLNTDPGKLANETAITVIEDLVSPRRPIDLDMFKQDAYASCKYPYYNYAD